MGAAETVDRVAASIENVAITQSDVEMEFRFELFVEGNPPGVAPDAQALERVRDRMVNQQLLAKEAEAENLDRGDPIRQAAEAMSEVQKKYPDAEAFQSALRSLRMGEQRVLARLANQMLTLRLIDQRLRPAAWVERTEIEAYYEKTLVPEYTRRSRGPTPALEEVENEIREILVQQRIDQLLEEWLEELKAGHRVNLHSF